MATPPADMAGVEAEGDQFWPLKLARELDDALLEIRFNELEMAVIQFKSAGDPAAVLAFDDFMQANDSHWLMREILLYWRRVLKRVDLTSRTIATMAEPGSCFAGTLAELLFAADRCVHGGRAVRGRQPAGSAHCAVGAELRRLPHVERADPAGDPLPG
jgi:benzoyl-CoA-dihydrodiol lyase